MSKNQGYELELSDLGYIIFIIWHKETHHVTLPARIKGGGGQEDGTI